ncbi:DUF2812 domain-containing protein [Fundicoccus culcitae]|uniref:DUF2812 domain-containing protein n=1 Tax=Fundicoccus culcitae TaxID=2969821 RepID=A0ABY5P7T2_9LACT|nr:DUF2812 domain-containing protein [Fundicoccus culcitae]UUX34776.1 DUF2812 domain-containing protein [Fundicoccus culcitae]
MEKTVYKVFMTWDYEREITWLNDMSAQGWQLKKPGFFRYTFEKDEPNKYQYALEYLNVGNEKMKDYFTFLEETGIEIMTQVGNWAYYRKVNDGKPFEIFNDNESKIEHFKRILSLLLVFLILEGWLALDYWSMIISGEREGFTLVFAILLTVIVFLFLYGIVRLNFKINKLKQKE